MGVSIEPKSSADAGEYEVGNTEYQEASGDYDTVYEVEPYEVVTARYKHVE